MCPAKALCLELTAKFKFSSGYCSGLPHFHWTMICQVISLILTRRVVLNTHILKKLTCKVINLQHTITINHAAVLLTESQGGKVRELTNSCSDRCLCPGTHLGSTAGDGLYYTQGFL